MIQRRSIKITEARPLSYCYIEREGSLYVCVCVCAIDCHVAYISFSREARQIIAALREKSLHAHNCYTVEGRSLLLCAFAFVAIFAFSDLSLALSLWQIMCRVMHN